MTAVLIIARTRNEAKAQAPWAVIVSRIPGYRNAYAACDSQSAFDRSFERIRKEANLHPDAVRVRPLKRRQEILSTIRPSIADE